MGKKTKVEFIESYIKHGCGDYEWSDNHGELVRCKDCTKRNEINCPQYYRRHEIDEDYYCADGVREYDTD